MIKILLGGSPCTYWSIAKTQNRETTPSGLGWELFENYLIVKEKFQPDVFIYENNQSAATAIKEEIRNRLGCDEEPNSPKYIEIDSALVSAQSRKRFYVHNCGDVRQPADRCILLRDIIENGVVEREKAYCLTRHEGNTRDYFQKRQTNLVFSPVRIGTIENGAKNKGHDSKQYRVYSVDGKATTLCGEGGGLGAKTGLYACPIDQSQAEILKASGGIKPRSPGAPTPVYEVKDGQILIKGQKYPINLQDGYYIIRKLTVKECCRLQTLPGNYCRAVSATQAYRGLGNGWTAEVIIHILNGALQNVPRDEKLLILSLYDGIGTGRYCLDKMGFTNVEYHSFEIDKYAIQIAQSNYPDIIQHGDAFQVRDENFALCGNKGG